MKALAAVAFLLVASCGGGASAGPDEAVESFYRAFEAGDCDAARKVVLRPDDLDCTVVIESAGALAAEGIDLDAASFTPGDIADSSATVKVSWGTDDPEVVEVERVDGAWLVVIDSAA